MVEPSDGGNGKGQHGADNADTPGSTWTPAVNVPSANTVSNTSALASEFIICFTSDTNTRYIATRTATQ